jgi:cyclopropane fatty-acyl-phospholipid synthase-like methyltransferase
MLELAEVSPNDVVYDLGCGDGRIVVSAAQRFGARGVGVELDPVRIEEATALAAHAGVSDRVRFICGDLFQVDISGATVVCLYLLPAAHARMSRKIFRELKPGTRILCHDYVLADWAPERTELIPIGPLKISQIYLWRVPPRSNEAPPSAKA